MISLISCDDVYITRPVRRGWQGLLEAGRLVVFTTSTTLNQKPDFLDPQNEIEFRFNLPLSLYILVKLDYLSIFLAVFTISLR